VTPATLLEPLTGCEVLPAAAFDIAPLPGDA
jgi:hypothetical protein